MFQVFKHVLCSTNSSTNIEYSHRGNTIQTHNTINIYAYTIPSLPWIEVMIAVNFHCPLILSKWVHGTVLFLSSLYVVSLPCWWLAWKQITLKFIFPWACYLDPDAVIIWTVLAILHMFEYLFQILVLPIYFRSFVRTTNCIL